MTGINWRQGVFFSILSRSLARVDARLWSKSAHFDGPVTPGLLAWAEIGRLRFVVDALYVWRFYIF